MAACEKCWADAADKAFLVQQDHIEIYRRLVRERTCTPEEQAGPDASWCPRCGKRTLHQYANVCMYDACRILKGEQMSEPREKKDRTETLIIPPTRAGRGEMHLRLKPQEPLHHGNTADGAYCKLLLVAQNKGGLGIPQVVRSLRDEALYCAEAFTAWLNSHGHVERDGHSDFTGLLDKNREAIFYGDLIRSGMRRDDSGGWTVERVERGLDGLPCLADPKTGERMEMQWDQELRVKERRQ